MFPLQRRADFDTRLEEARRLATGLAAEMFSQLTSDSPENDVLRVKKLRQIEAILLDLKQKVGSL